MNRRHLDWTGFRLQRLQKQKTGRNCLGPVADSKRLGGEVRGSGGYSRYTPRRMRLLTSAARLGCRNNASLRILHPADDAHPVGIHAWGNIHGARFDEIQSLLF